MTDIRDYIKCSIANKFTLTGYLAPFVALGSEVARQITQPDNVELLIAEGLLVLYSFGALRATDLGKDTVRSYRVSREDIRLHGRVTSSLADRYNRAEYCFKRGFELAIREAGLERRLS